MSATINRRAKPTATIGRRAKATASIGRRAKATATIAHVAEPRDYIVTDGLVAHYPFTDNSGQVLTDRSGNGHNGQLGSTSGVDTNDPTWGANRLTFDGVDDYVLMGSTAQTRERTLIAVCRPLRVAATTNPMFGYNVTGVYISQNTSNRFHTFVSTSGGNVSLFNSSARYVVGQDAFVCGVHSDSQISIWHGLTKESTTPPGTIVSVDRQLILGAFTTTMLYCNTIMHYALLYNRALSDAEIQQTYAVLQRIMAARGLTI